MRILKGLAWSICVGVMVLVIAFAWGRMRGPSERQAEALKLFARDMKPAEGRNAFPAMWLSDYDIPADQIDAVYGQERDDIRRWLTTVRYDGTSYPTFVSRATAKYPKIPLLTNEEKPLACSRQNKHCLARIRLHRELVRALLQRHAVRLDKERAYATNDFSWDDMPRDMFAPFASYGTTNSLWLASAALDFADGNLSSALQQVCTNALTQRRMHAHSNTVLDTLFAMARMENAASVFVQMLSALPPDQPLPDSCSQAFSPVGIPDVDLKASMQSKFQSSEAVFQQAYARDEENRMAYWFNALAYSSTGMLRQTAAQDAWMGSESVNQMLLTDHRFSIDDFPRQADPFDWLSNASGSTLSFLVQPGYLDHLHRQEDGAATLRLVATLLWLRQSHANGTPLAERLRQRPAWMRMAEDRHFGLSKDGRHLHMGYHYARKNGDDVTEWPLPVGL